MVANGSRRLVVNSFKISHLGIKPVSGGNPPSAMRVIIIIEESVGEVVHIIPRSLVVLVVEVIRIINMEVVISK